MGASATRKASGSACRLPDLAAAVADFSGTFAICAGRSVPYVEARVQVLGLVETVTPCVCEGGWVSSLPREDRFEVLAGQVHADAFRAPASLLVPRGARQG